MATTTSTPMNAAQQARANRLGIATVFVSPAASMRQNALDYWGLSADLMVEVKSIPFRNGEHHVNCVVNGEKKSWPSVFFAIEYV